MPSSVAVTWLTSLALGFSLMWAVPAPAAPDWTWPVEGEVITDYRYGGDPFAGGQHRGIDIAAPVGSAVRAATDGTVTFAGTAGDSGLTVAVRTADKRFDTSYLHLDSLAVGEGDAVSEGAELGTAGTSGARSAAEAHLHFGVRIAGEDHAYRDPLRFLGGPGAPAPPVAPLGPPRGTPLSAPPRPRPVPALGPRPVPALGPRGVPQPRPVPVVRPDARRVRDRWHAPAPEARPVPSATPAPASAATGFDAGWVVACAGAVVAAIARTRLPRRGRRRCAHARAGTSAGAGAGTSAGAWLRERIARAETR